jgi:hypothetical protein
VCERNEVDEAEPVELVVGSVGERRHPHDRRQGGPGDGCAGAHSDVVDPVDDGTEGAVETATTDGPEEPERVPTRARHARDTGEDCRPALAQCVEVGLDDVGARVLQRSAECHGDLVVVVESVGRRRHEHDPGEIDDRAERRQLE